MGSTRGFIARELGRPRVFETGDRMPSPTEVAIWMRAAYSHVDDLTAQAARGLAVRAIKAMRAGAQIEAHPATTPTREMHARDPTIRATDERYKYIVLAETGTTTQDRISRLVEVRSDTPLSRTEIEERVASRIDYYESAAPSTREALAKLPVSAALNITVIAAYRR